jgi:hypothetical protein
MTVRLYPEKLAYAEMARDHFQAHEYYEACRKVIAAMIQCDDWAWRKWSDAVGPDAKPTISEEDAMEAADRFIRLVVRNDMQVMEKLANGHDEVELEV